MKTKKKSSAAKKAPTPKAATRKAPTKRSATKGSARAAPEGAKAPAKVKAPAKAKAPAKVKVKAAPAKAKDAPAKENAKAAPAKEKAAPAREKASAKAAPAKARGREPHFRPELFFFFRELAANNEKAWFEANRERFERDVRAPMLRFVTDFAPHLARMSASFVADPRPSGGSLFRIHRDVRFAKDKSPYKTYAAMQFRHAAGKDVHAPGFYLHLEPGGVFGGGGLWHPDPVTLAKVRGAIVEAPARWGRALRHAPFVERLELGGDALSRPPRGFDPEHPLIADLKRTDFVAMATFTEKDACAPDFIEEYAELCRATLPFMEFLTSAVGLEF
jgi:uncharacterized protein (TIGR02453 family)